MSVKRTATILVVGGALAAWLAAAATSGGRTAGAPLIVSTPAIDARGASLGEEVARLRDRLRPTATPRQPGRNLFSFAQSARRPLARVGSSPTATAAVLPVPLPLKLTGIAEDQTPDGIVRTAIVSGFGQLFFVKEGQTLGRFQVIRISADVVELSDQTDGHTLRIALK